MRIPELPLPDRNTHYTMCLSPGVWGAFACALDTTYNNNPKHVVPDGMYM